MLRPAQRCCSQLLDRGDSRASLWLLGSAAQIHNAPVLEAVAVTMAGIAP